MAEPSTASHREQSLDLLDRGSRLPATSPQRHGLLLEALTHATLALSAADVPPVELTVVTPPAAVPAPELAEAPAPEPAPATKAPKRRRTPSYPATPEKEPAAA